MNCRGSLLEQAQSGCYRSIDCVAQHKPDGLHKAGHGNGRAIGEDAGVGGRKVLEDLQQTTGLGMQIGRPMQHSLFHVVCHLLLQHPSAKIIYMQLQVAWQHLIPERMQKDRGHVYKGSSSRSFCKFAEGKSIGLDICVQAISPGPDQICWDYVVCLRSPTSGQAQEGEGMEGTKHSWCRGPMA